MSSYVFHRTVGSCSNVDIVRNVAFELESRDYPRRLNCAFDLQAKVGEWPVNNCTIMELHGKRYSMIFFHLFARIIMYSIFTFIHHL